MILQYAAQVFRVSVDGGWRLEKRATTMDEFHTMRDEACRLLAYLHAAMDLGQSETNALRRDVERTLRRARGFIRRPHLPSNARGEIDALVRGIERVRAILPAVA